MTAATDVPAEEVPDGIDAVDPALLRVLQHVAHREYLLGAPARPTRTTAPRSPVRRRPDSGVRAQRVSRGTTARKVTWSR